MNLGIECGFNINDETINFGKRGLAENEPYESATLATHKISKDSLGTASVNSGIRNGQIFYSIGNVFGIFRDKQCSAVKFSCTFETIVDAICVSPNDSLIFVFLRNGTLRIIKNYAEEFEVARTLGLLHGNNLNDQKLFIDCYIEHFEQGDASSKLSLIIVGSNGKLFRLNVLESEDFNLSVTHDQFLDLETTIEISAFGNCSLFLNGSKMWIVDLRTNSFMSSGAVDAKYAHFAGLRILTLLRTGQLTLICPYTFLHFPIKTDHLIQRVSVLVDKRNFVEYVIAELAENELKDKYICLLRPDYSPIYSLKVSSDVVIVTPESETDEVHYISLLKKNGMLEEARFHSIYETDPTKKLARLLNRQMFKEAEEFAKTHCIDISIVNKEKAKLITEKLECTSKDIDELLDILRQLDDKDFILDCCLNVESCCVQAEDVLRVLKYACDIELHKKNVFEKKKQYSCVECYFRFKLFLLLDYDMKQWPHFSSCNMIEQLKMLIRQQQFKNAISVYRYMGTHDTINEEKVEDLINTLNYDNLDDIAPFLPTFIPLTLKKLPSSLPIFVNWLYKKVFEMEQQNSYNFPQNAIDFMEITVQYLKTDEKKYSQLLLDNALLNNDSFIVSLKELLKSLNHLQVLKYNYGVKVALKEFIQPPKAVIKILLSLELDLEVYNRLLQEFTYKFILENELNPDEIFWNELIDILNHYQESYWVKIVGSIVNCISSEDSRYEAVERILSVANLPWSDPLRQLGMKMLDSTHPKARSIHKLIEEEPIMIILKKIGCGMSDFRCSTMSNFQFLIKRIIKFNSPTMIHDAFILCQGQELHTIEVMRLLILHFIQIGDCTSASQLLDRNEAIANECIALILDDISSLDDLLETSEAEKYINFLHITEKFCSSVENTSESYILTKTTELIRRIHRLKTHFDVRITDEIHQLEQKKHFSNQVLSKVVNDYEDALISSSDLFDSCRYLSSSMELNVQKLLLRCCMKVEVNKNELICAVAVEFLNNSDSVKYLVILAVYLIQNLNHRSGNQLVENSFIDYDTGTVDKSSGRFLKLAFDLMDKALDIADYEEFSACLKIYIWVDSIYFLKRYNSEVDQNMEIYENTFDIENLNPSYQSLLAIQKIFNIFTSFITQFETEDSRFLTYFQKGQDEVSQDDLLNEIKDFRRLSYTLTQEGESFLAYKLLGTLQNQLMVHKDLDPQINSLLAEIIKKDCIPNLIQSSLFTKNINEMLFFHSLIWCNCKETEKHIEHALKLYKMSPNKVEIIAGIGVEMFQYHNQIALKKFCEQVKLSVKWWKIVKNYDINYNKFFKVDSKERLQLMLQTDNFCAKQIKEYCTDFNLGEIQTYYLIYLRTVLLNWKPKYEITTNCAGKRVLAMEENQDQQLFQKCKKIISLIEDKVKVEKMLQELWSQVNFYHYEVFMCILDISEQHTHVHLEYMLHFLKGYNRINAPGDTEQETWFSAFPESLSIDPLSEFRVLFNTSILDSKDIWNIIRKEISLKNYDVWFAAVEAFNHLTVDDVCSYLVKELVAQGVLKTIKPGDWFHTQQTSLFTEIDNCLQHMDNEEMKKTTAAYCLLCNTPEGADQVTIAKITYRYAQEYRNAEPDSCKSISFTKVEKKYQRCLSLQILHKNKLADQIYLDLILNIDQLLEALYQDVRIIKRAEHVDPYCPDINKAADELAEIFGSDIVAFRKKLIVDCLLDSNLGNSSSEMSSIFCRNLNIVNKDQSTSSENNLKRAAYICLSNLKFWQEYLFRVGYVSDDSNFFLRSRALKCLLAISNSETIQKLTTLSMESFMKIIENLTLSSITSKFSLQVDSNQSWKNITKKLAQIGNPDSIRALAEVCMLLKISQVNYWEYIIVNAEHFGMFSALRKYLEFTETQDYRYEKFYIRTWESLIDHSINTSLNMREEEMEKSLLENLFLLHKCPVLHLLNLERSYNKCVQKNRLCEAAILMQYIAKEKTLEFVKKLKSSNNMVAITKQLRKYESLGLVTEIERYFS